MKLPAHFLPDVPDGGFCLPDGANNLPDGCRTAAGRESATPEPAPPPEGPVVVEGKLAVGPMRSLREDFEIMENPDLRELLARVDRRPDVVAEAVDGAQFSVLDADTHGWPDPPSEEAIYAAMRSVRPAPEAMWASHGRGMKLVFTGPHHKDRAHAAAFAVPPDYEVELLRHTRLPGSQHSGRPGAECGPVVFNATSPGTSFVFGAARGIAPEQQQEALDRLGLHLGGRFGHDRCPIDPDSDSSAKDCVVAYGDGVHCFRCAARGARLNPSLPPGFVPYGALVGGAVALLDGMAAERVHWIHAVFVLRHGHPNLSSELLQEAYRKVLTALYGDDDPRVGMAFDRDLDVVWGEGVWLDSAKLAPTVMDNDGANSLPYCCNAISGKEGVTVAVDPARRAQAKHRAPRGYVPLRPYRGITFLANEESVPVPAQPRPKNPIRLLAENELMHEEDAYAAVERAFPRLDCLYLMGCLAAAVCAEAGGGQPPMLAASGPSGSGKGETIRLAASFLGDDAPKVQLVSDPEPFMRQLGALIAGGSRFLVFDEFGKVPGLDKKIHLLLQISSVITWRPLFQTRQVQTPCRAAIFYPCVRFPDTLTQSAEFVRRTRHVRLHRMTPPWDQTSGGDTAEWRDRKEENAYSANSLVTHTWHLCREHGFRFSAVADVLGLGSVADADDGIDAGLLRALFAHARNEDGRRVLFEGDPTFAKGWVNLDSARARQLVSAFVALDDAGNLKEARRAAQANLEAVAWNDVLGIEEPPVRVKIKIHGAKWGMRFQSAAPAMRGRERINEHLPPADSPEEPEGTVQAEHQAEASNEGKPPAVPADANLDDPATEALRAGGFPA